jgi:hypothetical protein
MAPVGCFPGGAVACVSQLRAYRSSVAETSPSPDDHFWSFVGFFRYPKADIDEIHLFAGMPSVF